MRMKNQAELLRMCYEKNAELGELQKEFARLEKRNKELDEALITSTKNNIERQKIIDNLQEELEKQLHQCEENYARDFRQFEALKQKQLADLEEQIEKMKSDIKENIKWADQNRNDQMWQKLVKMYNQWEQKHK